MNQIAIKLTKVSKKYYILGNRSSLAEFLLMGKRNITFWALRKVNIEINKGEKVGIIGPNGAGKTTLLSIISGITTPSSGSRLVNGKAISIIELEAGFHPDLSGVENIYLNAMIMGMKKSEIKKRIKKIIAFADIGSFLQQPMYSYSEGMKLRLAFSVAIHTNFDILVLDENFSVGDADFQIKSLNKIRELFKQKKTIIIATHYLDFMQKTCTRAIWLEKGKLVDDGPVKKTIKNYLNRKRSKFI